MNKPVLGPLLGGVLGVFDGLSALISAPEVAGIVLSLVVGYATERYGRTRTVTC